MRLYSRGIEASSGPTKHREISRGSFRGSTTMPLHGADSEVGHRMLRCFYISRLCSVFSVRDAAPFRLPRIHVTCCISTAVAEGLGLLGPRRNKWASGF